MAGDVECDDAKIGERSKVPNGRAVETKIEQADVLKA
jgi:hypothetical protein